MPVRTPVTLITGPLGSGKTTLLQRILEQVSLRLALVINEFGEFGIDGKVIRGDQVQITELSGGCVCCSLLGEFEAAVQEILDRVAPEAIVVETTGVAEPEALLLEVVEALPQTRVDGVIAVMDADALIRFPALGLTTRLQLEAADLVLLNKIDLLPEEALGPAQETLRRFNPRAPIIPTRYCQVDSTLLFGMTRSRATPVVEHTHQPEYESLTYRTVHPLRRDCFERLAESLNPAVYRAKGFVRFADETCLFNYVNGRWNLEPLPGDETVLVFIGRALETYGPSLMGALKACEA